MVHPLRTRTRLDTATPTAPTHSLQLREPVSAQPQGQLVPMLDEDGILRQLRHAVLTRIAQVPFENANETASGSRSGVSANGQPSTGIESGKHTETWWTSVATGRLEKEVLRPSATIWPTRPLLIQHPPAASTARAILRAAGPYHHNRSQPANATLKRIGLETVTASEPAKEILACVRLALDGPTACGNGASRPTQAGTIAPPDPQPPTTHALMHRSVRRCRDQTTHRHPPPRARDPAGRSARTTPRSRARLAAGR